MRFILILVLLAAAGFAGWVAGSLHPAPPAVLEPIRGLTAGGEATPAADVADDGGGETAVESEPEPEPEPEPSTTPAPAPTTSPAGADASDDQLRAWISEARVAHPYPESEDKMYAVMMCESGGNADIVNPAGPYTGLFQYSAGTWNGDWNTYRDSGMTDARAQIFATALAWNNDMQSHWGCYNRAH